MLSCFAVKKISLNVLAVSGALVAPLGLAQAESQKLFSPYAEQSHATQVYWGDAHVHSSLSTQAALLGNRLGPEAVLQFARGDKLMSSSGVAAQRARPLDWVALSDSSDNYGLLQLLYSNNSDFSRAGAINAQLARELQQGGTSEKAALQNLSDKLQTGTLEASLQLLPSSTAYKRVWQHSAEMVDSYNKPGVFSAFMGFEWPAQFNGLPLNRVVLFRDGADTIKRITPFTTGKEGSNDPLDLWQWMQSYEDKTAGDVLSISHSAPLASKTLFPYRNRFDGSRITSNYTELRAKWEPLYEVVQQHGTSESASLATVQGFTAPANADYAREGLKNGLNLFGKFKHNPYKFGFIGASGSLNGLASARENNFYGNTVNTEPSAERFSAASIANENSSSPTAKPWQQLSAGLTAVWARENTREALFDAMERKEVYASSGSRIRVRVFGGWNFSEGDLQSNAFTINGYRKGVAMGGDLYRAPANRAPQFIVQANKDPEGANLDRLQMVKGWEDSKGQLHERVYDIAVSDKRSIEADGLCHTAVGNTVNTVSAQWTNTIGTAELKVLWQDPGFDPRERAFYYVRVVEIPTPSWMVYDALRFGVALPEGALASVQEFAVTSPVWYLP